MPAWRRRRIAWWLKGVALLAVLVHLPGRHAARSGGLVKVEQSLDRPVLLVGAAIVLGAVSVVVECEFRSAFSQIGFAAVLVGTIAAGAPFVLLSAMAAGDEPSVVRSVHPDHPDRVLTVTDVAFSIDPVHQPELVVGGGWSARHRVLGTWGEGNGPGSHQGAKWYGPDRIVVSSEAGVAPVSGRPGTPHTTAR
ncbi:hypothetical protein [Kitasatospora sp. NPDC088783]|uniref:hypothetical protein n=1 Tax=Kitasatospora sp. NPDC088783 TaxID=3364077 RepID=UPI00380447AC